MFCSYVGSHVLHEDPETKVPLTYDTVGPMIETIKFNAATLTSDSRFADRQPSTRQEKGTHTAAVSS